MVSYSAIVLDEKSHRRLLDVFGDIWASEPGWEDYAHHMTICLGPLPNNLKDILGREFSFKVVAFAGDDKVKAVAVEAPVPTKKDVPHVTLAVNKANGGKPKMSNDLTDWVPVKSEIYLTGTVKEI